MLLTLLVHVLERVCDFVAHILLAKLTYDVDHSIEHLINYRSISLHQHHHQHQLIINININIFFRLTLESLQPSPPVSLQTHTYDSSSTSLLHMLLHRIDSLLQLFSSSLLQN
ncbi:hypothetical protein QVD17_02285 [Tagetes erecta]|uniref:Uncharacterized protein n=1 Tax=Tagetes erecta TaxID=13708 RepID=A0AAD8L6B5_TARER|nr:hypothetical protein QVD17_02285 [Tagetes erecta]